MDLAREFGTLSEHFQHGRPATLAGSDRRGSNKEWRSPLFLRGEPRPQKLRTLSLNTPCACTNAL